KQYSAQHARKVAEAQREYDYKVEIEKRRAEERDAAINSGLQPGRQPLSDDEVVALRDQMEDQVKYLTAYDESLEKRIGEHRRVATQSGVPIQQYEELQSDIKSSELMLANLRSNYEREKLEAKALPRVASQQRAELMKKDIKKQVLATIVAPLALICGVCGGL